MNIFRKKDASKDRTGMRRHLKIPDLILLGIGAMVGTGIFTITGTGAAKYAGPALTVSIVISALCVSISALFYAEFASRIPANGGAYSYIYAVLGEFPAWLAGWLTIMEFMTAISERLWYPAASSSEWYLQSKSRYLCGLAAYSGLGICYRGCPFELKGRPALQLSLGGFEILSLGPLYHCRIFLHQTRKLV